MLLSEQRWLVVPLKGIIPTVNQEFKTPKLNLSDLLPLFNVNLTDKSIKTGRGNHVECNDSVSVFVNDSFEEEILGKG